MAAMTWHGTCSACGGPVTGGTDDGTLDIPVGWQIVICLTFLCLCEEVEEAE